MSITADVLDEADETFTANLSGATNATIGTASQSMTITDNDATPTLSIGDVTVVEGDSGTTNATFDVVLSAVSGQMVTADYTTTSGTATEGTDFADATGTLTFAPGETSKTVMVAVNGDTDVEPDETFNVAIGGVTLTNATLADGAAVGTITDDDALNLTIADVVVDEAAGNATFTVTLSQTSIANVTVDVALAAGTAVGGGTDYGAASATTLTFTPGQTQQTFTVPINDDLLDEDAETFYANLSNATGGAVLADAQALATITDDDATPGVSISATSPTAETGTVTFTATLSAASGRTVTVEYATEDGSAVSGEDYTGTTGTLTFVPGDTSETFTVSITADVLDEADETFTANLSGATNATIGTASPSMTITDNDATPTLSIGDVTVVEGDSGTTNATFDVVLSAVSGQMVTADYTTTSGTATEGTDFADATGTLTFAPGETSKTVMVAVNGDTDVEPDETFNVAIGGVTLTNATLADGAAVGTITDDDALNLTIADVVVDEAAGNATFTVTLSQTSIANVTVDVALAAGTAVGGGTDYGAASATTLTFTPGQTQQTFTVPINDDLLDEDAETFYANLSNATGGAVLADAQALATITDDDATPGVSISATSPTAETGTVTFTATLSTASGRTVTVEYATEDGSAVSGEDYTGTTGTLTFVPGDTSETFTVSITADVLDEADETFTANLSGATNATIGTASQSMTITDNDATPTLSIGDVTVVEGDSGTTNATFDVVLSAVSGQMVTADYTTTSGTATEGTDFADATGTLTFAPGGRVDGDGGSERGHGRGAG